MVAKNQFGSQSQVRQAQSETNHCMLRFAEYLSIFEEIDNSESRENAAFEAQNFRRISERCVTN